MTTGEGQLGRGVYCPVCGYDLRGTPGGRCSECGTEVGRVGGRSVSRIPWVHRRYRGRVKAYWQTMGLVMFRPWKLAEEAKGRVTLRDARGFHRVSVVVATVSGTGLIGLAFPFGADRSMPDLHGWSLWLGPALVSSDQWWGLAPLAVAVWAALTLWLALFRGILGLGLTGFTRRRARRVGLYASGLAVPVVVFLGLAYGGICLLGWMEAAWVRPRWAERFGPMLPTVSVVLGILAALQVLIPAVVLVARTGRWKALRAILMVLVLPVASAAVGAMVTIVIFWLTGYGAMAIRSMTQ